MVNTELVELIDAGLERFGTRDLISGAEVLDFLLDSQHRLLAMERLHHLLRETCNRQARIQNQRLIAQIRHTNFFLSRQRMLGRQRHGHRRVRVNAGARVFTRADVGHVHEPVRREQRIERITGEAFA